MDPVKVVIFVVAFLLLLLLGRKLSSSSESTIPGPLPEHIPTEAVADEEQGPGLKPAVVGADLPFPIHIPEITQDEDGRYNRPEFLNYYFEETDLLNGPQDPTTFYDHFYLEVRDIENNHPGLYKYFVATPLGLQKALANEKLPAIYLEQHSLIVARWDVPLILETVVKQVMQRYAEANDKEANALPDPDVSETNQS
jgi:hypothetical protein